VPSFESGLGDIAADRQSGSRAITYRVVELLLGAEWPSSVPAPYFALRCRAILSALPHFALIYDLLHATGATLFGSRADRTAEAADLRSLIDRWRMDWDKMQAATTMHAVAQVPPGAALVTLSNSAAVEALCCELARRGARPRVVVGESEPGGEGRVFARALHRASLEVALVPDAELPELSRTADAVVLGADAVFSGRFVNKVGSANLADIASSAGRPVWILAETAKWAPGAWGITASGAVERETLFESVPGRLVKLLISERGALPFASAAEVLDRKPVFRPLVGS
jgi:translation initiation factor 2B subunit (eIF-2B alpha/beta/delta family)